MSKTNKFMAVVFFALLSFSAKTQSFNVIIEQINLAGIHSFAMDPPLWFLELISEIIDDRDAQPGDRIILIGTDESTASYEVDHHLMPSLISTTAPLPGGGGGGGGNGGGGSGGGGGCVGSCGGGGGGGSLPIGTCGVGDEEPVPCSDV